MILMTTDGKLLIATHWESLITELDRVYTKYDEPLIVSIKDLLFLNGHFALGCQDKIRIYAPKNHKLEICAEINTILPDLFTVHLNGIIITVSYIPGRNPDDHNCFLSSKKQL